MPYISHFVPGVPYGQDKSRGDITAPKRWTDAVVSHTKDLPRIEHACILKVTFLLPPDKFPTDLPYGPDVDNLLKRFMDALSQTIFSKTPGKDSCVVSLNVTKARAESLKSSGVHFEILPVDVIEEGR